MSKLRRVAEVGDGSYEQTLQRNAAVVEEPLQAAQKRKKRYSLAAEKEIPQVNQWEQLQNALRVDRKSFSPQSKEEFDAANYSPYDTSGRSVRRYESDEAEIDDTFDPVTIAGFHMYSDPKAQLEEMLKESMVGQITIEEQKLAGELEQYKNAQAWDEEANAWAQKRLANRNGGMNSASDVRGSITKTANENIAASGFGQTDYDAVEDREIKRQEMIERMKASGRDIKRASASKPERKAQWENLENARSKTVQGKMRNSSLLDKLAQLTNE